MGVSGDLSTSALGTTSFVETKVVRNLGLGNLKRPQCPYKLKSQLNCQCCCNESLKKFSTLRSVTSLLEKVINENESTQPEIYPLGFVHVRSSVSSALDGGGRRRLRELVLDVLQREADLVAVDRFNLQRKAVLVQTRDCQMVPEQWLESILVLSHLM